jgi:tetratricopeptide (TPR) repeat protein
MPEFCEISYSFALEAEEMLNEGREEDAVELCKKGIEHYPDYSLAYLILSKALIKTGQKDEAWLTLLEASEKFPLNQTFLRQLDDLHKEAESAPAAIQVDFDNFDETVFIPGDNLTEVPENTEIIADEPVVDYDDVNQDVSEDQNIDMVEIIDDGLAAVINEQPVERNNFLKLVSEIDFDTDKMNNLRAGNLKLIPGIVFSPLRTNRKLQYESCIRPLPSIPAFREFSYKGDDYFTRAVPSSFSEDFGDDVTGGDEIFVTDTMANIYALQGAYEEAIKAYDALANVYPGKSEYYEARKKEVKSKMKN